MALVQKTIADGLTNQSGTRKYGPDDMIADNTLMKATLLSPRFKHIAWRRKPTAVHRVTDERLDEIKSELKLEAEAHQAAAGAGQH